MRTHLREAQPDDLDFLWEMLYASIYFPPGQLPIGREILRERAIAHYLDGWGRTGDAALIAEVDGRRAGAAWYRCMRADDPGFGFVAPDVPELGIALLPWARGQGMGTALLQALAGHARAEGFRAISLSVDPANPAMRLYERLGWSSVGGSGGSVTMLRTLWFPGGPSASEE